MPIGDLLSVSRLFSGQHAEELDFRDQFQPRSESSLSFISDTELPSLVAEEPNLEAMVQSLITTARNGDLNVITRFVRMLGAAVQEI